MKLQIEPPFAATSLLDAKGRTIYIDSKKQLFVPVEPFTLPSAVTLAGYAMSLAWIAGAPWWVGVLGVLADEIDGRLARKTGAVTRYGGELDYAVDLTLTGLTAVKLFGPMGLFLLPVVTSTQAKLRSEGERPVYGSARAVMTIVKMVRG